jgi:hypothetical protein
MAREVPYTNSKGLARRADGQGMARAVAYTNSEGLARRADVPSSRRADIVGGGARDSASVGTDRGWRAPWLIRIVKGWRGAPTCRRLDAPI